MDKYVNTDIGIYHVESVCENRASDGHKLYHVKCRFCEFESDMKLFDIKNPKTCRHKSITGRIIDFKPFWENQRLGRIYAKIIARCYDDTDKSYRWYGQKGVKVCQEWLNNPKTFEIWALNNGYTDSLTIDRIEVKGDYTPDNCRWISAEENSRRAGKVNWIVIDDKALTGRQWADRLDLGLPTINRYIRKYGLDKTKELIKAMLKEPPSIKQRKPDQSWFSVYNIEI